MAFYLLLHFSFIFSCPSHQKHFFALWQSTIIRIDKCFPSKSFINFREIKTKIRRSHSKIIGFSSEIISSLIPNPKKHLYDSFAHFCICTYIFHCCSYLINQKHNSYQARPTSLSLRAL